MYHVRQDGRICLENENFVDVDACKGVSDLDCYSFYRGIGEDVDGIGCYKMDKGRQDDCYEGSLRTVAKDI